MNTEVIKEAATVEDAMDAALEELGVQQDAVGYEILQEPGRKLFGRGSDQPARIRVWLTKEFAAEAAEGREPVAEDDADEPSDETDDSSGEEQRDDSDSEADEPSRDESPSRGYVEVEREPLTDEQLDEVADAGIVAIEGILGYLDVDASVEEYEGDDGEIILDIVGSDLGILIGRHGKTLDAMQTIVTTLARRQLGWYYPVLVDVEGYRSRRRGKLESIARNAADKAVRQDRDVELRPMNSYERKIVHISLRNDSRVTTESDGNEPNRFVIVSPS